MCVEPSGWWEGGGGEWRPEITDAGWAGNHVPSDHVRGVQKGQVQRCPPGTAEAQTLFSTVMTGAEQPSCFLRVCWNHLWTWEAEKNLDVIVGHKFEGGTLKAEFM